MCNRQLAIVHMCCKIHYSSIHAMRASMNSICIHKNERRREYVRMDWIVRNHDCSTNVEMADAQLYKDALKNITEKKYRTRRKKLHAKLILSTNRIKRRKENSFEPVINLLLKTLSKQEACWNINVRRKWTHGEEKKANWELVSATLSLKIHWNEGENVERKWSRRQWTRSIKSNICNT